MDRRQVDGAGGEREIDQKGREKIWEWWQHCSISWWWWGLCNYLSKPIEPPTKKGEAPILWPPDAKNWLTGKRPWCWERLKAGGERDNREWDGWFNRHEFEETLGDSEGQPRVCSPWGHKESDTTEQLSNKKEWFLLYVNYTSPNLNLIRRWGRGCELIGRALPCLVGFTFNSQHPTQD